MPGTAAKKALKRRTPVDRRTRFKRFITRHFFLRFHMALILGGVFLAGVLANKLFLLIGMRSPVLRYPLAVLAGYAVFIVLVRLWIEHIARIGRISVRESHSSGSGPDLSGVVDGWGGGGGGGGSAADIKPEFGGGSSGGGGASDLWSAPARPGPVSASFANEPATPGFASASGSSSGSKWPSFGLGDLDFDSDSIWILVVFALFVAVLVAAGGYVIYQAPDILSDAAVQAALAGGLLGPARRLSGAGWVESVVRRTCIPLILVLAMALVFGLVVHHYCPGAAKFTEALHGCLVTAEP